MLGNQTNNAGKQKNKRKKERKRLLKEVREERRMIGRKMKFVNQLTKKFLLVKFAALCD